MANEILFTSAASGLTMYVHLWNTNGQIYNGTSFETYLTANIGNYDIPCTELGTASKYYAANMPSVSAGQYQVWVRAQAGGSPAESDSTNNVPFWISWDGNAMVGREYDAHVAKAALTNKQTQTIATGVVEIRNNADNGTLVTLTPSVDNADNPTTNTLTSS